MAPPRLARQLDAADAVRHHAVRNEKIDRDAARDDWQCLSGIGRMQNMITKLGDYLPHDFEDHLVVIDDQYRRRRAGPSRLLPATPFSQPRSPRSGAGTA